jgi:asparagine synthase (glutamine-hydrolysing)
MCGIVGFWTKESICALDIKKMSAAISHRGPDDSGVWSDNNGLVMAHRRLSILDLSHAGHQPMESKCGRYILTYNGEIYNHKSLRKGINKLNLDIKWEGQSDTETLLVALSHWGIEKTLKSLNGMFAFALFDRKKKILILARDRLGQKPLYYGYNSGIFLFGSELKSIKSHSSFSGEVDRSALSLQLKYSYIPAPKTIYKGVSKLSPGTFLEISLFDIYKELTPKPYWSFLDVAQNGINNRFLDSEDAIITKLDDLLNNSVKSQLISDVPLGAFLSAGIDSSMVAALMQKHSMQPVKTFTIGFNDKNRDEAVHAKKISNYLGTDHTELYVTAKHALDVIPLLPILYDEPFSDSSQIPTFLLSKMTQKHVKVALSGDGADELFGGYNRHFKTHKWWERMQKIPKRVRTSISKGLKIPPDYLWDLASIGRHKGLGDVIHKLSKVLSVSDVASLYDQLTSHWDNLDSVVIQDDIEMKINKPFVEFGSAAERIMTMDTLNYLPDDILTKMDRAAMGVSLETRMPFLDHNVVEFAWQIPLSMKIHSGSGKCVLKKILNQYIPKEMLNHSKKGFGVPLGDWLRTDLRDWAEELLNESRLRQEGYFHPEPIRRKWEEHLSCQNNWQYQLWDVLMFQAWLEVQ